MTVYLARSRKLCCSTFAARRGEARRISSTKQDESDSRRRNYSPASSSAKRALETSHSLHSRSSTRGTLAPCATAFESVTTGNEGGGMFNGRKKLTFRVSIRETRASNVEYLLFLLLINEKSGWKNVNEGVYN